jgi:hypothetical protein
MFFCRVSAQEKLLADLTGHVVRVFTASGHTVDSNSTALSMLSDIEKDLSKLVADMQTMDPEFRVQLVPSFVYWSQR